MVEKRSLEWKHPILLIGALGTMMLLAAVNGEERSSKVRIGSSGALRVKSDPTRVKSSLATLQNFIKDETGVAGVITPQKDWLELADKLEKRKLDLGIFQGYEFAWAKEKFGDLEPLAIAVDLYRYPVVYVVVNKDNRARDFAGLKGQTLCLSKEAQPCVRLFVDRQTNGKKSSDFFSRITFRDNVEDALDDVVDGVVQATALDRAALEAYKRRKPGRFNKLKEVARSQPFPPAVIAYRRKALDESTRSRFQKGLLRANQKEKGKMMMTLFHLTRFEAPPADFDKVLARARKAYPPDSRSK